MECILRTIYLIDKNLRENIFFEIKSCVRVDVTTDPPWRGRVAATLNEQQAVLT